jgi:hypothetical protein
MYVAAHVLSTCCICFTNMLQVFYLDVAYVSYACCKCFYLDVTYVSHILQQYVSSVSYVSDVCCIQVFHVASVSREHGE